jgi:hypothetical protein
LLESPHRPLRSADELIGEAGWFREPIRDGAAKDDLLRGAQVDQVTKTGLMPSCVRRTLPITSPSSLNGATAPRLDPGSRCVPMSRLLPGCYAVNCQAVGPHPVTEGDPDKRHSTQMRNPRTGFSSRQ